jgi:hypothetical protein
MKKLLFTLMMCLTTTCFSQLAPPKQTINLNLSKPVPYNQSNMRVGPAMLLGGASFILAGALTPPTMAGGSTTQKKPIYQQVRMLPIITGSLTIVIGAGFSLGGG